MPNTRKKVIKTVYKNEEDSEEENKDFSDSGSDAKITEQSSSEDELDDQAESSGEEFKEDEKKTNSTKKPIARKKTQFAKSFINRIRNAPQYDTNESDGAAPAISVKDLTDADKQLPSFLNLSESGGYFAINLNNILLTNYFDKLIDAKVFMLLNSCSYYIS